MRWLLIYAGGFCTVLGVAGIFLPLIPTVPLLLLAAACFARSSPRCYNWLIDHPRLGPIVTAYLDGSGIPIRAKLIAITTIWFSISLSLYFAMPPDWVRIGLLGIAGGITLYLLRLPTLKGRD